MSATVRDCPHRILGFTRWWPALGGLERLLRFGHVAGDGEHAEHFPVEVAVDRRAAQNMGQSAVPVAHGQRVVGERTTSGRRRGPEHSRRRSSQEDPPTQIATGLEQLVMLTRVTFPDRNTRPHGAPIAPR
jgi:hypothetical protein